MAEGKNKVVVYADWISNFEELTDLELGKLMRHFFDYINDKNPVLDDRYLKIAWKPIENTLKRDLKSWEDKAPSRTNKARIAGLASAEARRVKKELYSTNKLPLVENELNPTKPTVSVSVSDSVSDTPIYIETPTQQNTVTEDVFLKRWCDARTHYDKVPTFIKKLTTFERVDFNDLRQDYELKDFERAMQGMFQQSTYPKTRLRPSHFLKRDNFEPYLTCFTTKEKLFEKKGYKKQNDRL